MPPALVAALAPFTAPFTEVFTGCNIKSLVVLNPVLATSLNPPLNPDFTAPSVISSTPSLDKDLVKVLTSPSLAIFLATEDLTALAYLAPFLTELLTAVLPITAAVVVVPFPPLFTGLPFSS